MLRKINILFVLVLMSISIMAQELTVIAPSQVKTGNAFQVKFECNAKATNFKAPNFGGLTVQSGPYQGSSSSVSIINGKVNKSESYTFTYLLYADQEGTFTIGPASCTADGKTVKSTSATIKVVKGNPNSGSSAPSRGGAYDQQQQQQRQNQASMDAKSLFVRMGINKTNPYLGEECIITYKIYTQLSLHRYEIDKLSGIKGFWSEDLSEGKELKQYEETVDGRRYTVAEIRRGAIYGQQTGTQKIEPLQMDVLAMVPVQRRRTGTIWDLFDDPFFNQAQAVEKHLTSNSLSIKVKDLPAVSDDKNFSGAVGKFTAKAAVDQTEVKANEAVTYSLTINGHGNLMLIEAPEMEFPKVFEVYDPKISDKLSRSDGGISGSRTFEWVLIPQSAGNYEIPSLTFTYFDPSTGKYVTTNTDSFSIKVAKGDGSHNIVSSTKNDVNKLNDDINHIKTKLGRVIDPNRKDLNFILFVIFISLLANLILLFGRKRQDFMKDEVGVRQSRAIKQAKKRLRNAEKYLGEGKDSLFYEEIYKALWGCLSDKYRIPMSQLSRETVTARLEERKIPQEQFALIMGTLESVDEARFAPGDSSVRKQDIYNQTLQTIAAL